MKRLHINLAVADLDKSVRFYASLFAGKPSVLKDDYAKWMLDDPHVNFSISTHGSSKGVDPDFSPKNSVESDYLL